MKANSRMCPSYFTACVKIVFVLVFSNYFDEYVCITDRDNVLMHHL